MNSKHIIVKNILSVFVPAAITAVITYILFGVIFCFSFVRGDSMEPNYHNREIVIGTRINKEYKYGDVIICKSNVYPRILIKRIIATAGDTIDIDFDKGIVYVNGSVLDEPYIAEPTQKQYDEIFPMTVKENCVFVMGDNRNHSLDSRSSEVGQIELDNIISKIGDSAF